ncbi:MAG: hypothetical protein F6K52_20535 [Moorea sp. SIO3H5]|nr:hypothetical protein [Moorena sp. SIO3H5]
MVSGIARTVGVSKIWLQKYVNKKYAESPRKIKVSEKLKGKITIECDEMWSFVKKKDNQHLKLP